MSAQNVKKVSARLQQAKREMLWAIGALEDTDSLLDEYSLSQREKEKLLRQFQMELSSIEADLARVLSVQSQAKEIYIVTEREIGITELGDVASIDESIKIGRIPPGSHAIVGQIPPHEDEDSITHKIVSEIPPNEDTDSIG